MSPRARLGIWIERLGWWIAEAGGRLVEAPEATTKPGHDAPAAPEGEVVTPEAEAMIANPTRAPASQPVDDEPLEGSVEARKRAVERAWRR